MDTHHQTNNDVEESMVHKDRTNTITPPDIVHILVHNQGTDGYRDHTAPTVLHAALLV